MVSNNFLLTAAKFCSTVMVLAGLAGCESSSGGSGAKALPSGASCASVRSQLAALDRKGVPSFIESQNNGKKLSKSQQADVASYNHLLDQYLGSRCHV